MDKKELNELLKETTIKHMLFDMGGMLYNINENLKTIINNKEDGKSTDLQKK